MRRRVEGELDPSRGPFESINASQNVLVPGNILIEEGKDLFRSWIRQGRKIDTEWKVEELELNLKGFYSVLVLCGGKQSKY